MSNIKYNLIILISLLALGLNAQVVSLDFNATDESWVAASGSGDTYWEWGTPAGTQINDDNSGGGNAWVIGLSGDFNVQGFDDLYLTSAAYDLSSLSTEGSVSFAINHDLGTFSDGPDDYADLMIFQYSLDNFNWTTIGSTTTGDNWYNLNDGFGGEGWANNSGGWILASHDLPSEVFGQASVYFRFYMFTNAPTGTYGSEGFALDDFQVLSTALPSNEAEILTFSIPEEIFSSNIDSAGRRVDVFVASSTDVSNLTPTFTISNAASVDVASDVARDFTNDVVYTVTAENGSTTDWRVSVTTPSPGISLFPTSGIEGTEVFIYGRGFSTTAADNTVSFGGITATVTSASANKLAVNVPAGVGTGINEVTVTSNGISYFSEPNFTVVTSGSAGDFLDYKQSDFDLGISKAISLEVADFDGDGDLDFAYDNNATLSIATIEGGVITSTTSIASGRSVTSSTLVLETSDVNKDGFPDIIAGGARLGWFKNNGDGTWSDENVISSGVTPASVALFDVDGDFDEDIVVKESGSASIYKNSGSESFNLFSSSLASVGVPIDWDEDGDIDMISSAQDDMTFQQSVVLLENNGSGVFTSVTIATTSLLSIQTVQVGDLDNDGDLDIVYTDLDGFSTGESTVGYLLNNGDGTFASEVSIITTTTYQEDQRLELGDLNGDGFLDIARTTDDGSGDGWFYVYLSSAVLTYAETQLDGSINGQDVELIDINNDGDLDILQESSQSGGYFPLYVQGVADPNIASFSFVEQTGAATINTTSYTVDIEVNTSADLTTLVPTISLVSDVVFISPASGVANDFSGTATYTVETVDGNSTQDWTINVSQVPEVPAGLSSDAEQTSSAISWTQANAATGYEIELSDDTDFTTLVSGFDPLSISSGSTVSADLTGLAEGTSYYLRMRSVNANGTYSTYSDTLNFVTKPADPVLADIATSAIGQDTVALSWAQVPGVVDSYSIEIALSNTFTTLVSGYPVDTTSTKFVLGSDGGTSALSENTTYYIRITASNTTGTSGYSNIISVLTKPETPVVNALDATSIAQTQATVSWNAVFSGSGSYVVDVSSTDFDVAETLLTGYPLTVSTNSEVIGTGVGTEALTPATTYWVRVRSSNASGESASSNVVNFLTRSADPVLTDVSQADIGQTTINLSWDAVDGADDYSVEVATNETFSSIVDGYPATAASNSFVIGSDGGTSALSENTTYYIRIAANNATGASGYSNTISVLTKAETPVVNAIDLSLVEQTQATVTWNSVFSGSGSYTVDVSSTDFDIAETLLTGYPLSVSTNSEVVGTAVGTEALAPATNYWVRVRSVNASGESTSSNVVNFLTRSADPVLTDVSTADLGQTTINLSWDAVEGAENYSVEVAASETFSSLLDGYPATATSNSFVIGSDGGTPALSENTTYYIRITANNATGSSGYSNTISALTKPETPVLNAVDVSLVGQTQATVSWNSVFSGSGSYEVEVSSTDFVVAETLLSGYPLSVNTNSEVVGTNVGTEALQTATSYWVRVRSSNASGASSNSNVVSFLTIPADPVALPATDVLSNSFVANWETVMGAGSYEIEVSSDGFATNAFSGTTTETTILVDGLTIGTTYEYRVRASNTTGFSNYSSEVSVATNRVPGAPTFEDEGNEGFVEENQTAGTVVGGLISDDDDDTHTFSFISGTGDTNNDVFDIDGNNLITTSVLDFENKENYTVRVQATDPLGEVSPATILNITVIDVNDVPSNISLELIDVGPTGYDPIETEVGIFSTADDDTGDTDSNIKLELIDGQDSFEIVERTNGDSTLLRTAFAFTNEVDLTIPITVRATDDSGASFDKSIDVVINAFVDTEAPQFTETLVNPTSFVIGANYDSLALKAEIEDFRIKEVVLYKRLLTEAEFTTLTLEELPDQPGVYVDSVGQDDLGVAGIEYYFLAMDEAGNSSIWSSGREFAPQKMGLEFPEDGEGAPVVESVTRYGRTIDSYQIISIPFIFDNVEQSRVSTLFEEYGSNPDNRTWRIIRYNQVSGELDNLAGNSTIEPGEGYFFIAQEEKQIIIENAKINTQDPFMLELQQGWNLIGNPYNLDIDFDGVRANNDAVETVGRLRVLDTENPETWPATQVLRSLEGGFVFAEEDITLEIRYTDAFLSFGGRVAEEGSQADWFLPITLEQGSDIRKGGIGMDQEAKISFDKHDEPVLPRWLKYLEMSFKHEGQKFDLNKDVVPFSNSFTWEFDVASSATGFSTLKWGEESAQVVNLKLYNTATGEIIDMTTQDSYQFELNEPVKFKLLYSEDPNDTFEFEELQIMDAYPNPFVQSFKVPLLLPTSDESYQVSVRLMDLSGKVVSNGAVQESNGGTLHYEMEKPYGMMPGVYLYQVKIANTRTRKIITKRIRVQ